MKAFMLFLFLANAAICAAQDIRFRLDVTMNGKNVVPESDVLLNGTDSIRISTLKFYMSGISFYQDEQLIFREHGDYFLIDLEDPASLQRIISQGEGRHFNRITFDIGIDSITNVAGALSGALDPARGMYWTWQSGYINVKLEGSSLLCPARNNKFQYHLGGYLQPHHAASTVSMVVSGNKENLHVLLNLDEFITKEDLMHNHSVMIPGKSAKELSLRFASSFKQVLQ